MSQPRAAKPPTPTPRADCTTTTHPGAAGSSKPASTRLAFYGPPCPPDFVSLALPQLLVLQFAFRESKLTLLPSVPHSFLVQYFLGEFLRFNPAAIPPRPCTGPRRIVVAPGYPSVSLVSFSPLLICCPWSSSSCCPSTWRP